MLYRLSLPVAEATDGELKCFIRVSVKVSGLEGPGCWSLTTTKEVGWLWVVAVLWVSLGSAELVG